jgi:fibro-slime domain-containing protein
MNPFKTLVLTLALLAASAAAQARTVYFYPPDDAMWIAGRAYISGGTAASAVALTIEPTKCGWYKASFSGTGVSQFWLGKPGKDRIGPNGRWSTDFEPTDDFNDVGGVFRLADIFTRLGSNNIYFVADELAPTDPTAGWYGTDPGVEDPTRCKWELAAFIYDTDPAVHPDFSCGTWRQGASEGNGTDTKGACEEGPQAYSGAGGNLKPTCTGVVKGLVKQNLNPQTKKIECENCTKNGCWTNADWFNKAFTSTQGVNVERCYNMPFTQIKTGAANAIGSFEFDSDKMQNAGGRLVGGFFPELLNSAPADASCPSCNTKRTADRFPPRIAAVTKEIFDEYQSKEGDFKDGDTPPRSAFGITQEPTGSIYDWGARPGDNGTTGATWSDWYLHGTTKMNTKYITPQATYDAAAKANQHFCFESHAEFYYDPAQVFYFSGDDPIWVYINNKLVIDLGGAHMAAPAHVNLNTLGLTEGELYPIDIFFCDQRTVNSNARITTNMYVVQKSNFYSDPKDTRTDNYMCVLATGGSDCASKMNVGGQSGNFCGPDLINNGGYTVDFYMVRRGTTDTIWLSQPRHSSQTRGECSGTGNTFTCYSGISVKEAVYSCGGRTQCKGNPEATSKVQVVGNFNVYARLMSNGQPHAGSKPLLIDNFKSETNTRMVWGNLVSEDEKTRLTLKDAYDETTKQAQTVIAGKRTPIYIASGSWSNATTFLYDNDPEFVTGKAYSVSVAGGTGLKIYSSKEGTTEKTSGTLPASGVDTLWVEGAYTGGNKEFSLNVVAESESAPSLKLTVYQPTLKFFTENDYKTTVNPVGYTKWGADIPYVGSQLPIYIAAWDPVKNEICSHCNFVLREESFTNKPGFDNTKRSIVEADVTTKITDGKFGGYIHGTEETVPNTASWKVTGPSPEITTIEWTELKFRDAPVPVPMKSFIFDRNGDGIGDSVTIEYNKSFSGRGDSLLPVLLAVSWEPGDTVYLHLEGYTVSQLKDFNFVSNLYNDPTFFSRNRTYWNSFIKDSIVTIAGPDRRFSKGILTYGKGNVSSWTPFIDLDNCIGGSKCSLQYSSNTNTLTDRISPIVIKAEYKFEGSGNCDNISAACPERLTVRLSEPVFAAGQDVTMFDFKNPFSYCLGRSQSVESCPILGIESADMLSQTWNNLDWGWEQPSGEGDLNAATAATYKPGGRLNAMDQLGAEGHTTVEVVHHAYKTDAAGGKTRMPQPGDWVKIRSAGINVFVDAESNGVNPRERGVIITGTKPTDKEQIRIGEIGADPNAPVLGGIFAPDGKSPPPDWFDDSMKGRAGNALFKDGNVAEFLPVPDYVTDIKEIKRSFPGSVGTLFKVDVNNANSFRAERCTNGDENTCKIMRADGTPGDILTESNINEAVTIHASAYYHTNLGDYTAHRDPVMVRCTDEIFKGDCLDNKFNFYLAWDLKTNKGRFVGAGAYVAISKFYWQLNYFDATGARKTQKFDSMEFIEMFGVKRAAVK